jgi:hypothetical protein
MITIDLTHLHVIVTLLFLLLMFLGNRFGDSEKSTAWMFFLIPLAIFLYVIYWTVILFGNIAFIAFGILILWGIIKQIRENR